MNSHYLTCRRSTKKDVKRRIWFYNGSTRGRLMAIMRTSRMNEDHKNTKGMN